MRDRDHIVGCSKRKKISLEFFITWLPKCPTAWAVNAIRALHRDRIVVIITCRNEVATKDIRSIVLPSNCIIPYNHNVSYKPIDFTNFRVHNDNSLPSSWFALRCLLQGSINFYSIPKMRVNKIAMKSVPKNLSIGVDFKL